LEFQISENTLIVDQSCLGNTSPGSFLGLDPVRNTSRSDEGRHLFFPGSGKTAPGPSARKAATRTNGEPTPWCPFRRPSRLWGSPPQASPGIPGRRRGTSGFLPRDFPTEPGRRASQGGLRSCGGVPPSSPHPVRVQIKHYRGGDLFFPSSGTVKIGTRKNRTGPSFGAGNP
jgi:hypothetical protein